MLEEKVGKYVPTPTIEAAKEALHDIDALLKGPPRKTGHGYKPTGLDMLTVQRLREMRMFLCSYCDPTTAHCSERGWWTAASLATAKILGRGIHAARTLRERTQAYIEDCEEIPENIYGTWNKSAIDDEDLAQEIQLHLQGIGPDITAHHVVEFINNPKMLTRLGRTKTISHTTATKWMSWMGYRWLYDPKGQYVDGHERADVVNYHQNVFLPAWKKFEDRTRSWTAEGIAQQDQINGHPLVIWFHDESTFYAHDHRRKKWIHKSQKAVPYAKGEGASLMVADFVSADYGWLRSPDGSESARVLFKAGKAREGYFTSDDIMKQASAAMDIVQKHFPDEDHLFVYDNATTHLKRPDDALSARKMSKGVSKPGTNFGVERLVIGENGKPVYTPDGKILKEKVNMANGKFADGTEQEFYFPDNHPTHPGLFKGMANILTERGFSGVQGKQGKWAQCGKNFSCVPGATDCCCRRILYSQPDFVNVESLLETECKQCWGYAKCRYRYYPPSSKKEDLKKNVTNCLDGVPLTSMRRFSTRSCRFMDAYYKGLDGKQAAWAAKKFRGVPESILNILEEARVTKA
ncbi:hypothetical protein BDZ94DRAFT_1374217 [Collybia nuda]|uniref:Uncharacterized protein n=1 Tax=Collybia nuda TaxID=64659 RepID=A0A9P5Y3T6_9AGAR|nr:hypothetical protein BDZ94DRAFT_1374217 [Collybia nuda]